MHRCPELMVYAAYNDGSGTLPGSGTASRDPGQGAIESGCSLDVQRHPVQTNKKTGQSPRIRSRGMQSNFESERPYLVNRIGQPTLQRGFATAEYHRPQHTAALLEKIENVIPLQRLPRPSLQQVAVLAIAAVCQGQPWRRSPQRDLSDSRRWKTG